MSLNRQLIDAVKQHFAQKSAGDLEEIVQLEDRDQWSEEAFVAAREVLAERGAGRAKEPLRPVKDEPPHTEPQRWSRLLSVFGVVGFMVGDFLELVANQPGGGPVPFGSNIAWLALETNDAAAVASALCLQRTKEATWADGVAAAHRSFVFVTPPLGGWTLAVGSALLPPEDLASAVKPLVEELSRHFRDAQYFCTHQGTELHAWARAQNGSLVRGYGWLGQRSRVQWNEGPETDQERSLRFRFTAGPSEPDRGAGPTAPNETCVLRLASLWSINPKTLEQHSAKPAKGLLGALPRQRSPAS